MKTETLARWSDRPYVGWAALALGLVTGAALSVSPTAAEPASRAGVFAACVIPVTFIVLLLRQLRIAQQAHIAALEGIAGRSKTVDRMLEFAQTVQSAGKPEQVFTCMAQFLQMDLGLAGVVVLSHEPENLPGTFLSAMYPKDFARAGSSVAEMDMTLCPCVRQNLPRQFRSEASPVRCSVDAALELPKDHPAFCVPFVIGRKTVVLVHMLLAPGKQWTEERQQLAQTYINTASSSLITLHHLSEAEKQSLTDGLTALYNRRSLDQLLLREVALSERHGSPLSVVMIDMDKFKEINDAHGHAAGDHLLKAFADCVRITLRKTDMAFRYGGDEFVIALPQTTVQQAQAVVQKVKQAFASVDFSDAIAHLQEQPTLSMGVAQRSVNDNTATLQSLLAAADTALYAAKKDSRDCIRVYSPQQAA